jgi:acetolactate synthase-1/2/3 large subunit
MDWRMLAGGFGNAARSVDHADGLADALAATLAEPGPALLRIAVAPLADALPMFIPGGPAREMVG